jgi:predicted acetyltransferase
MSGQLEQVHAGGEPVAALWSSEPGIYGRFGYGPASHHYTLTVPRGHGAVDGPDDPALTARIVPAAQAQAAVGVVFDRVRSVRPGMPARDDRWWARCVNDPPSARPGAYALWSATQEWSTGSAEGRVEVREALSADAAASRLLWQTLLSMDLVGAVSVRRVAVDDPLVHQLRDPRRAHLELRDALYVRVVDLAAALPARGYEVAWRGVVDVADDLCPWNQGRWRLSIGPDDAAVERTDLEPDLVLDVRELGAAYLGGTSLVERAAAGHVKQVTPGALAGLSRAFRSDTQPFCPFVF